MANWIIQGFVKEKDKTKRISEIEKILLKNRGIKTKKQREDFFHPPHPFTFSIKKLGFNLKQVKKALARISKAIEKNESIVIYGDYDADGITGTAILWETIYSICKKTMPYLPNRVEEGYGLSKKGIDNVIKQYDPDLIITVDNGITAHDAVSYAKTKGIDVIITDHHTKPKSLPWAFSIIHSILVSGSGVAWFLAREINKAVSLSKKSEGELLERLSLCAIGTITDILPLDGVNRSIVTHGIYELKNTLRPGLLALYKEGGVDKKEIDTFHVGYIIGPRINASGRISDSINSLRLLCTYSQKNAATYSADLGSINRERRKITEETLIHADSLYKKNGNIENKVIFVYHESYNQGVIGLVAGKLVEKYYRPVVVLSVGKTITKASVRSVSGFDIIKAIRKNSTYLFDYGGHPMAAGFTIETDKIEIFKDKLTQYINTNLEDTLLTKLIKVDCEINLSDVNKKLYTIVNKLKPFGSKNHEPVFVTKNLRPVKVTLIGKDSSHLKIVFKDANNIIYQAIGFGMGNRYHKLSEDKNLDCVYSLLKNEWRNTVSIEMRIKDFKVKKEDE